MKKELVDKLVSISNTINEILKESKIDEEKCDMLEYENRAEVASNLSKFQTTDDNGVSKPYFNGEWIARKIFGMTEAELEDCQKYWKEKDVTNDKALESKSGKQTFGYGDVNITHIVKDYKEKMEMIAEIGSESGYGYYILPVGEKLVDADEYLTNDGWKRTIYGGRSYTQYGDGRDGHQYRRAIPVPEGYVLVPVGNIMEPGDECVTNYGTKYLYVTKGKTIIHLGGLPVENISGSAVFRKKVVKGDTQTFINTETEFSNEISCGYGYYFVPVGETLLDTDEYYDNGWKCTADGGSNVDSSAHKYYRRVIPVPDGYELLPVGSMTVTGDLVAFQNSYSRPVLNRVRVSGLSESAYFRKLSELYSTAKNGRLYTMDAFKRAVEDYKEKMEMIAEIGSDNNSVEVGYGYYKLPHGTLLEPDDEFYNDIFYLWTKTMYDGFRVGMDDVVAVESTKKSIYRRRIPVPSGYSLVPVGAKTEKGDRYYEELGHMRVNGGITVRGHSGTAVIRKANVPKSKSKSNYTNEDMSEDESDD